MAKQQKTVKVGDDVQIVLANGKLSPAKIVKVNRDETVDLEFLHLGKATQITASPFDEEGKKPDCWCNATAAADAAKTE